MGLKKEIVFYGSSQELKQQRNVSGDDTSFLPFTGGRSSVPEIVSTFAPSTKLVEIPPDFAIEYLSTLENLAAYNSDISYALDNIVQLANTPHSIEFADSVSESQAKIMKLHLKAKEASWYSNSGGLRSLKADLLAQVVINGALSSEAVPDEKLRGIKQVVRVSPKVIRFIYNPKTDEFDPYQLSGRYTSVGDMPGLVKLNPLTYKYIALRRYFQSPYATPPFISAIEALVTQKDMLGNFKNIMQKLGMLGFLSAEVTEPQQLPGEDKQAYWNRCLSYLENTVYPQLQKNLGKGMVAGFKDKHKFELQGNNMNVQGAEGLFKLVQGRIFAGVKQDPNMLGENYSVTETFGRVILAKMLSQVEDYQTVVDTFLETLYSLELKLAGFSPGYVKVTSEKPLVTDKVKEEQAEEKKIANVKAKRDMGIISQTTAAQELGYDEAEEEGDIAGKAPAPGGAADPSAPAPEGGDKTDPAATGGDGNLTAARIKMIESRLGASFGQYPYSNEHKCGQRVNAENFAEFTGFSDSKLEGFSRKYFNDVNKLYKDATKRIAATLGAKLANMSASVSLEIVQRESYLHILSKWESEFAVPVSDAVGSHIPKAWEHYRSDKGLFAAKKKSSSSNAASFSDDIPDAVLALDDYRAITYMEASDELYLGKFITDKDTKRAVQEYLKQEYLEGTLPIGNSPKALEQFQKTFASMLDLEAWKIRRVIDTTMNKVRNYANVMYLEQGAVSEYEIIEVNDNLTCQWCAEMDGKTFSVQATKEKIMREVGAGAGNVSYLSPFLTTQKIEDIKGKTADELQALGFNSPPYHPHCRGSVAAKF